jgi:uncharacterized protein YegP (UPF0339 family)
MYFEIVKKTTPVEGTHWHARIRVDEQYVLFRSADYAKRQTALEACEVVKAAAPEATIYEVSE